MNDFPDFTKHPSNRIVIADQATPGVAYVPAGADERSRGTGPVHYPVTGGPAKRRRG